MKTTTLLSAFGRNYPKHLAKKYGDYVGLMCGKLPVKIERVLITLDLEYIHASTVLSLKPDLILTHHPFIYGSKSTILKKDERKRAFVAQLEQAHIPVYSLHTNFDEGKEGMNDALAQALGLQAIKPLLADPMARGGLLKQPMDIVEFSRFAKQQLRVDYGLLIQAGKSLIQSVAIVGGGGSRSYVHALQEGYDLFISGDAPHHVRRSIVNDHYNYLELPHEIEHIFVPKMIALLRQLDEQITILTPFDQPFPRII